MTALFKDMIVTAGTARAYTYRAQADLCRRLATAGHLTETRQNLEDIAASYDQLANDMDRLKAVPYVDVTGLSLRLDQAIAVVDTLPLALEQRVLDQRVPDSRAQAPPVVHPDEPAWRRFLRDVWSDVRALVRIENLDRPELPLIAPQEQFFLRENLKLRLLSARFDLFLRDQAGFHRLRFLKIGVGSNLHVDKLVGGPVVRGERRILLFLQRID